MKKGALTAWCVDTTTWANIKQSRLVSWIKSWWRWSGFHSYFLKQIVSMLLLLLSSFTDRTVLSLFAIWLKVCAGVPWNSRGTFSPKATSPWTRFTFKSMNLFSCHIFGPWASRDKTLYDAFSYTSSSSPISAPETITRQTERASTPPSDVGF